VAAVASVVTAPCRWRAALVDGATSQGGDWHGGRLLLRSARVSSAWSAPSVMAGLRGGAVRRWLGYHRAGVARGGRGVCGHGAVQVASSAGRWRGKPGWRLAWRELVATQRKGQSAPPEVETIRLIPGKHAKASCCARE